MATDDEEDEDAAEGSPRRDRITLNPRATTFRYLKQLVRLGIYGKTPTTAAARLVDEGIRRALSEGLIERERED